MNEVYDLIYAENIVTETKREILSVFPDAVFEDASDYIHIGRFDVSLECNLDEWRMQMFLLGMFEISLHMQMWRIKYPDEYIAMMRKAVDIKHEERNQ